MVVLLLVLLRAAHPMPMDDEAPFKKKKKKEKKKKWAQRNSGFDKAKGVGEDIAKMSDDDRPPWEKHDAGGG